MELLIPSWAGLAGWGGVLVVTLLFIGIGRVLTAGRAAPEAALVAGWGGAALVLTLWGVATAASLVVPAALVMLLGAAGCVLPRTALRREEWHGMGRLVVIGLPLLAVMASARPSLPDTFLNLLPNAAYLWDHNFFPADSRPDAHSLLPGAPYNMQLAGYLVSLLVRRLSLNAMIGFNLVLQLAMALLLARAATGAADEPGAAPSWTGMALGLVLALLVNPGFVPRYDLSDYSEASVSVVTGLAGWFAADVLERLAAGRRAGQALILLSLGLAALVNIKQDSVALVGAILVSAAALALMQERGPRGRALAALLVAALPAAALYLAWRWYVLAHFAVGELKFLPLAQWNLAQIPLILRSMAADMAEKAYFVLAVALALAALLRHWRRHGLDRTARLAALFVGVALLYNGAVFFTYVAHYDGGMGDLAHSYFRYNTHLAPLLMLSLVLLARAFAAERGWAEAGLARRAAPAVLAAALAGPIVFFGYLRFDLEPAQLRAWRLAAAAAPALDRDPRLALLLPGDNGSVAAMLDALIRFAPPRHPDAALRPLDQATPQVLAALAARGYRFALLSCGAAGIAEVPPAHAALLERDGAAWRPATVWTYPPAPLPVRRSHVLADAPLCLSSG
ncbi:MAG TPA: hypothetical protein VE397_05345 [Stellaceae bacterium]|nr:hypothetical protein [Stellaceae bacterium]